LTDPEIEKFIADAEAEFAQCAEQGVWAPEGEVSHVKDCDCDECKELRELGPCTTCEWGKKAIAIIRGLQDQRAM
jgi:hypothetical protein